MAKFDIHTYGSLNYVYVTYDNLFKQIKDLIPEKEDTPYPSMESDGSKPDHEEHSDDESDIDLPIKGDLDIRRGARAAPPPQAAKTTTRARPARGGK